MGAFNLCLGGREPFNIYHFVARVAQKSYRVIYPRHRMIIVNVEE